MNAVNTQTPHADTSRTNRDMLAAAAARVKPGGVKAVGPRRSSQAEHNGANMLALDFLPDEYRQRDTVRKIRLWQLLVVLMFGAVIASAAAFQYSQRRAIRRRLAAASWPHAEAQQNAQRLTQLQTELKSEEKVASLYVFLRHPWPRTQILATTVLPLPNTIRLEEIQVVHQPIASTPPGSQEELRGAAGADGSQNQPRSDLETLRDECRRRITVVQVTGVARSPRDLHRYLASVAESSLVRKAELHSLESVENEERSGVNRFEARIEITPGLTEVVPLRNGRHRADTAAIRNAAGLSGGGPRTMPDALGSGTRTGEVDG